MTEDMQAPEPVQSEGVTDAPEPTNEQVEAPKPSEGEKRRASIQKAFKAIEDDEPEKPANGSQSTPKPDPKAEDEKAEAKADKKPDEQAEDKAPKRAPDGKFAAKEADKAQDDAKAAEPKGDHAKPPSRFSSDAKAEWEKAPESIRAETHRAIREMEKGIQQKDQRLRQYEPWEKMAKESGTTVSQALERYTTLERAIAQNPQQGLRMLAQNLGMTPSQMADLLNGQQPGQADPRDQQIMALQHQLQQMQQQFGSVTQTVQQQQQQAVMNEIARFAESRPRFDELLPEIIRMVETGYASDLADAYAKAERLNPAPQQAPEPEPSVAPPAQTRQPARSLTGAPSAGSNPSTRKPSTNRKEALSRAFRQAGLA